MEAFDWTCKFCNRDQAVTDEACSVARSVTLQQNSAMGLVYFEMISITCASPGCRKLTVHLNLYQWTGNYSDGEPTAKGDPLFVWPLLPESAAKPQPPYIPEPLRNDYIEACRISDLSPKASATLARRCLQGMIRDFCGISAGNLDAEIRALTAAVSAGTAPKGVMHDSIDAIDAVRRVGNIGAHMEKDINIIVDIEPGEAQSLIGLVELLFEEWYVARHERESRLASLKTLAGAKAAQKTAGAPKASSTASVKT